MWGENKLHGLWNGKGRLAGLDVCITISHLSTFSR